MKKLVVALVGLVAFSFAMTLGGQGESQAIQPQAPQRQKADSPPPTNEADIDARKKTFMNEASDLEAMAKSLSGAEFDVAMSIDQKVSNATEALDATIWFVALYDQMQCGPDRNVAKAVLKNRLAFYSYLLGLEADQTAGQLAFARLPATAQAGQRIKEELRAAKNKLDELAATLN